MGDTTSDAPAPPASFQAGTPAEWEARMEMVERMLKAFRFERFSYLAVTFLACAVLLVASARLFALGDKTWAFSMFGSSGVLTIALSKMLRMWNQAWRIVTGVNV